MSNHLKFYINGEWVDPVEAATIDVINPATEQAFTQISAGSAKDIDRAVVAARTAFDAYSEWSVEQRLELLGRIEQEYRKRSDDIAKAISDEMGAPIDMSRSSQAAVGVSHIRGAIRTLQNFSFESIEDGVILRHEPIGVCGMITPWNWPMNQVAVKVAVDKQVVGELGIEMAVATGQGKLFGDQGGELQLDTAGLRVTI